MTLRSQTDYDLKGLLEIAQFNALLATHCHDVGKIEAFDPETQTAQISLNYKQSINGSLVDYPVLIDCPVIVLGGGTGRLTFPIQTGDECLVCYNDKDIDNWYSGNSGDAPNTPRIHSITDAIGLVGLRNLQTKLSDYDSDRVELSLGQTAIKLGSKVQIQNSSKDLKGVLEGLVDLIGNLQTALNTFAGSLTVEAPAGSALATSLTTLQAALTLFKTSQIGGLLGDS